jgi:hypothetical protein
MAAPNFMTPGIDITIPDPTEELSSSASTITQVVSAPAITTGLVIGPDGVPITGRKNGIIRAPSLILRPRIDSRFALPRETTEELLDRLVL